jgi:cytochrome b subunit of formate dehydrogenase
MKWLRASLFAQAILALYFQLIQWLPLGQWNHQPGFTPLGIQVIHGDATALDVLLMVAFVLPGALFWLGFVRNWRWVMWSCTLGYAIWLALQIMTWWVAYIFGASDSWARVYQRVFSQSTQLLPTVGRHLPPDGMHLILHVLLTAVVVLAVTGLRETSREEKSSQ